ncbi:hypothetical protein [Acutalibacter sp. 1XD8-33]|uniref:hypothetical protein n=1 Tax=Acutalibacter sp. 1XD8-33 TaxID=2320081 RepID=UPI0011C3B8F0|nr:hypothetical protein [Acutalibacter sp. 1XD8-33]
MDGAIKLTDASPSTKLLCTHWGTVDAPDSTPFNADPLVLLNNIEKPERILVVVPEQAVLLERHAVYVSEFSYAY